MSAHVPSVDLSSPEFEALTPKQAYVLAHMSGSGSRVWFSGSQEQVGAKQAWLAMARSAWIDEIIIRTGNKTAMPLEGRRLTSLLMSCYEAHSKKAGSLAQSFADAFPEIPSGDEGKPERRALCALAFGCPQEGLASVASFSDYYGGLDQLSSKATMEQARAESERLRSEARWSPGAEVNFVDALGKMPAPSLSFEEAPIESMGWARVGETARAIIGKHLLGWIAIDESLSSQEALQALDNLGSGMDMIETATGLGPGSAGLGGWSVRIGERMADASGQCNGGAKCIALGRVNGDGAYAHEWLHALDFELGTACGIPKSVGMLSEATEASGPLPAALSHLMESLLAPSEASKSRCGDPLKRFAGDFLANSGVRNSLKEENRERFDESWLAAARDMFEAGDEAGEKSGLDKLKAVYRSARPNLADGDFDSVWAGFKQVKHPDPKFMERLAAASGQSAFYQSALEMDLADGKVYRARNCEMLARAFESSFALEAARDLLGTRGKGRTVSMVSGTADSSHDVPQGAERDRARAAFASFFRDVKSALSEMGRPPAWAAGLALSVVEASVPKSERLVEKLLARRGEGALAVRQEPSGAKPKHIFNAARL